MTISALVDQALDAHQLHSQDDEEKSCDSFDEFDSHKPGNRKSRRSKTVGFQSQSNDSQADFPNQDFGPRKDRLNFSNRVKHLLPKPVNAERSITLMTPSSSQTSSWNQHSSQNQIDSDDDFSELEFVPEEPLDNKSQDVEEAVSNEEETNGPENPKKRSTLSNEFNENTKRLRKLDSPIFQNIKTSNLSHLANPEQSFISSNNQISKDGIERQVVFGSCFLQNVTEPQKSIHNEQVHNFGESQNSVDQQKDTSVNQDSNSYTGQTSQLGQIGNSLYTPQASQSFRQNLLTSLLHPPVRDQIQAARQATLQAKQINMHNQDLQSLLSLLRKGPKTRSNGLPGLDKRYQEMGPKNNLNVAAPASLLKSDNPPVFFSSKDGHSQNQAQSTEKPIVLDTIQDTQPVNSQQNFQTSQPSQTLPNQSNTAPSNEATESSNFSLNHMLCTLIKRIQEPPQDQQVGQPEMHSDTKALHSKIRKLITDPVFWKLVTKLEDVWTDLAEEK